MKLQTPTVRDFPPYTHPPALVALVIRAGISIDTASTAT